MTPDQISAMCEQALQARDNAYAPYSRFRVGSAVFCQSGQIYTGCNIENASYGLTVCAERVALFNAINGGDQQPLGIAVVTSGGHYPCGACRQVMAEFSKDLRVFIGDSNAMHDPFTEKSLQELLPGTFKLRD